MEAPLLLSLLSATSDSASVMLVNSPILLTLLCGICIGFFISKHSLSKRFLYSPSVMNKTALRADLHTTSIVSDESLLGDIEQLSNVAESLDQVCATMIDSQYVLKDNQRYPSIFQTPLRDGLQTLRNLSIQLKQNARKQGFAKQTAERAVLRSSVKSKAIQQTSGKHTAVNSAQVFEELIPPLRDFAELHGILFEVQESSHGLLSVPLGLCEKIIRELCLNAILHNEKGTTVLIKCSVEQDSITVTVEDNGRGVKSVDMQKALAEYRDHTVVRNRRMSDAESHLNLCLIARLLKQFSGKFEIISGIGFGTKVSFHLPVLPIRPQPYLSKRKRHPTIDKADAYQRKKVLFVGQHVHGHNLLKERLSDRYTLCIHQSFNAGLAAVFDFEPDILIADFSWQNALSIQLCQFLRNSDVYANIPFVMLSNVIDSRTRVKAYAAGVTAILEKPLDTEELIVVCESLLQTQETLLDKVQEQTPVYNTAVCSKGAAHSDDFAIKLRTIVEAMYREEGFKLADVAKALFVSERTITRKMKQHFGMSFKHYLRQYRAKKAKVMLESGMTITEVSFELGFSSTSYFGASFKEVYGYPPSLLSKSLSD